MGCVFDHALSEKLVYRFGRGDKHLKELVVAVIWIIGHFDFRSILGKRADVLYDCALLILKVTPDFTHPAEV